MKIAFVGKGGSGKSTCTALYASYLSQKHPDTNNLIIDADFNMHVGMSLGFPAQVLDSAKKIGEQGLFIKEFVKGTNKRIRNSQEIIKTTPPGLSSQFVRLDFKNNPLLKDLVVTHEGINLITTGTFQDGDVGSNCFHKYTGIVEIFLNHLLDNDNEHVVVDMTAGVDAFGTGLFVSFDVTYMIVEPTIRSLSVFRQYKIHAEKYGVHFKAIGNKVSDSKDEKFLQDMLGDDLVASLSISETVKEFEKGQRNKIEYAVLEKNNKDAIHQLHTNTKTIKKDWNKFYTNLLELHKKNNEAWAEAHYKHDLTSQIDPDFSYEKVL